MTPYLLYRGARRVGRDVGAVHGAVKALLDAGVLSRTGNGRVEFPFEVAQVEFMLEAAQVVRAARPNPSFGPTAIGKPRLSTPLRRSAP